MYDHTQIVCFSCISVHPYAEDIVLPHLLRATAESGSSILSFHWPRKFLTISGKWVFSLYSLLKGKLKARKKRRKAVLERKYVHL